jgi:hypothetical protein
VADESDLVISGGGQLAVASDELFEHARALESISDAAVTSVRQLFALSHVPETEAQVDRAASLLMSLEHETAVTAHSLRWAADAYGEAERLSERAARTVSASLGYTAGLYLPVLGLLATGALVSFAIPGLITLALVPGGAHAVKNQAGEWMSRHRAALLDPSVVAIVRASVSSIDDGAGGVLHVPPGVVQLLGDDGLGITGVATSAAAVSILGGRIGPFAETPVRVTPIADDVATEPRGIVERFDRIPRPSESNGGAQVRIDRIEHGGKPDSFEVYISGTVTFDPQPTTEPWDLTSNIAGVGELPAGSYRAVAEAMQLAGVTSSTPVVFTGHSQGGLVATALAASGDYATAGLVTMGAPGSHIDVAGDFPVIAFEHTDDLVPALSGYRRDHDAVVVERRAFAEGAVLPDSPLASHERSAYRQTAQLAEGASDERLVAAMRAIDATTSGTTRVTSHYYRAERVPDD